MRSGYQRRFAYETHARSRTRPSALANAQDIRVRRFKFKDKVIFTRKKMTLFGREAWPTKRTCLLAEKKAHETKLSPAIAFSFSAVTCRCVFFLDDAVRRCNDAFALYVGHDFFYRCRVWFLWWWFFFMRLGAIGRDVSVVALSGADWIRAFGLIGLFFSL